MKYKVYNNNSNYGESIEKCFDSLDEAEGYRRELIDCIIQLYNNEWLEEVDEDAIDEINNSILLIETEINAISLSDREREQFVEYFYGLCGSPDDYNFGNPLPWGCPWLISNKHILRGESIAEMAENYLDDNQDEIDRCVNNEETSNA
jgi:hypothetical protein